MVTRTDWKAYKEQQRLKQWESSDSEEENSIVKEANQMLKKPNSLTAFTFNDEKSMNKDLQHFTDKGLSSQNNLTNLTLRFNYHHITDTGINYLMTEGVSKLKNLQDLELEFKNGYDLTLKSLTETSKALIQLNNLNRLKLGFYHPKEVNEEQLIILAEGIAKIPKLTTLNFTIHSKDISSACYLKIHQIIFASLKSITRLAINLSIQSDEKQSIKDEALSAILKSIENLSSIYQLHLECSEQPFGKIVYESLCHLLVSLQSLKILDLNLFGVNSLNTKFLGALSQDGFINCQALEKLSLNFEKCNIGKDGVSALVACVKQLPLKTFTANLDNNPNGKYAKFKLSDIVGKK